MIGEICAEIKNFFTYDEDKHIGIWSIVNGAISPTLDYPTDYIRIVGSHKNDGVHRLSDRNDTLTDEGEFYGAVWIMSPPKAFLDLAKEIADWNDKYGGADSNAMSPYTSESFGGYTYMKSSGETNENIAGTSWQKAFASRLKIYRKIRV